MGDMTASRSLAAIRTYAVFLAGMTSLGLEITASRLLGNVFGTTNLVWANIIGLILIYLTIGYFLGGRLADRSPHDRTFFLLLCWAAFSSGLIPLVAQPVLRWAAAAVEGLDAAIMAGSFLAVLVLFSLPVTLLGCVSPFAIRLSLVDAQHAGSASGRIYAISTMGSILGTFLPVLYLIPTIGTAATFLALSGPTLIVALVGAGRVDRRLGWRLAWMPLALAALAWLVLRGPVKSSPGQVYEAESPYNYIQVREVDGVRYLLLNEGQAVHSVYDPQGRPTYGTWDYFLAAPFFNAPPVAMADVSSLGVVGLAAGTIAKQYTQVFGPLPIVGWEIDPDIIDVGRRWFDMNEPNLQVVVADGRWGLDHTDARFGVIGIDAYRPPYIPWQLATREFFRVVCDHLEDDGVLVINVGRTQEDRRLIDAMVGTLASVFPSVHVVDVPGTFNSMVYATVRPTAPENLLENLRALQTEQAPPLLLDVLQRAAGHVVSTPTTATVFTDDRAPVEQLVNSIVIRFVLSGQLGTIQ
jgi:spermidine synthase